MRLSISVSLMFLGLSALVAQDVWSSDVKSKVAEKHLEGQVTGEVALVETKNGRKQYFEKLESRNWGKSSFIGGRVVEIRREGPDADSGLVKWLAAGEVTAITQFKNLAEAQAQFDCIKKLAKVTKDSPKSVGQLPKVGRGASTEIKTTSRKFKLPLQNASNDKQVERYRLFLSRDEAKTWQQIQELSPNDESFIFAAPEDGRFVFALQIVYKNGKTDPPTITDLFAMLTVVVESLKD